jgi:hypothetical protein
VEEDLDPSGQILGTAKPGLLVLSEQKRHDDIGEILAPVASIAAESALW